MINKSDIFRIVREQAQKVTGIKTPEKNPAAKTIDGHAVEKNPTDAQYKDLQQLFRYQFPSVTRQLLGKRYNTVNNVSKIFLPNGMEQAADELLELLSDFASQLGSTENVLSATGAKEIQHLWSDSDRSKRAATALKEVNKVMAAAQGFVSGSTGLLGAAVDLPASVIFSFKTIYEVGHSYGFELNDEEDYKAVLFALSKIDLSLIAEKQAIFFALRTAKKIFATGDVSQVTSLLSSNYSVDQFKNYLVDANGQFKWPAFDHIKKLKAVRFALPLVGGAVGAIYNLRLIEEIAQQADDIFSKARVYINSHPDQDIFILDAYHQQEALLNEKNKLIETASPLLLASDEIKVDEKEESESQIEEAKKHLEESEVIESVQIIKKTEVKEQSSEEVELEVSEGLAKLAEENIADNQQTKEPEVNTKAQDADNGKAAQSKKEADEAPKEEMKLKAAVIKKSAKKRTASDESESE